MRFSTTIAAVATPLATGGLSVIRITGPDAIAVADRVFVPVDGSALSDRAGYTACYGRIVQSGEEIDDGVALVYRAPKSYTGEDVVELSCHGGLLVTQKVLRAVFDAGAVPAAGGEFTRRAFLNQKLTLTQAEAVVDLINAQSDQAARSARRAMNGALYQKIRAICDDLIAVAGHLSAWVDYPEEEIEQVEPERLLLQLQQNRQKLQALLQTYDKGRVLREGIDTVIAGKPNVGKSTLMNLLAGMQKSIVTEIPGTTRDVVEETVNLDGVILRLADTAGLRETKDVVERIGVDRSRQRLQNASLVLAVFDGSDRLTPEDIDLVESLQGTPAVAVVNKLDLPQRVDLDRLKRAFDRVVCLSAKDPSSVSILQQQIVSLLELGGLDLSAPMLFNERQRSCAVSAEQFLAQSVEALQIGMTLDAVTVTVESAIQALLELSGEKATDAVIDDVFSRFCVGK